MNDKGLYIHLPFCRQKCPYCDFVSYTDKFHDTERYISAVLKEGALFYGGCEFNTVYIGGGTPSAINEKLIQTLMQGIQKIFKISDNAEITIEANPNSLNPGKLSVYCSCGINRISIGVQSFNDETLLRLGRIHSSAQAKKAVLNAKNAGFKNISIDLMFSIPHQTPALWQTDLETAVSLDITHISCYGLKIEPETPFYKNNVQSLDDETDRIMYRSAVNFLDTNGFKQYEISNFAKNANFSRHNLIYWHCGSYAGLGVSAHSYINGKRYFNTSSLSEYINNIESRISAVKEENTLTGRDKNIESLIMGMRLTEGVPLSVFKNLSSEDKLIKYISGGFIKESEGRYSFTSKGIDVSNTILADFI